MVVEETALAGVKIITPRKLGDHRGFFSETYSRQAFAAAGIDLEFADFVFAGACEAAFAVAEHFGFD